MSYNLKYTIDNKRLSNKSTHIEILSNGWTGGTTALKPDATLLTIQMQGSSENIFSKTIGTEAHINIISNPLSLITLFNDSNPQANIVKIYNSSGTTNLIFQGFVNPVYTEDYSLNFDTQVSINCNDGMQLLDTIYYKKSDGTFYTGNTTIATVINNILSKLNLTINNIYSNIDLTTNGYEHNLFKNIKVNQLNYIDESLVPMSCREVLDSIFGGIDGLKIQFIGSDLYIINPINLNDATKGRKYTLTGFTESTSNFGGYVDIMTGTTGGSTSIGIFETGQSLDSVNSMNEISIKYNPYNITGFAYDFNSSASGGSFSHVTIPSVDYYRNMSVLYSNWTELTSGGTTASNHFIGLKQSLTDGSPIYGLLLDNSGDVLTYTIPFSNINPDTDLSLKLSIDSYCQTRVYDNSGTPIDNENIYGSTPTTPVYGYYVVVSLKCGDLYFNGLSSWLAGERTFNLGVIQDGVTHAQYAAKNSNSIVNDTWATTASLIQITNITGGSLTFKIYCVQGWAQITYNNTKPQYLIGAAYRRILVKNIKIDIVNSKGNVINNNGILTRGNISTNQMYKTNVNSINITSGCGNYGVSKGSFFTTSNQTLLNFGLYRDGMARMTENLIIQSYQSQYKISRLKLLANLNVKNYGLSLQNKLIKNSKYLNKAFYIAGYTYTDDTESMNIESVEIVNGFDSL